MEWKALIGVAMIVIGTALFVPGVGPSGADALLMATLVVATALLTAGTYLVGTSEEGRPV